MKKKYPFRSLTEVAGWLKKQCERCGGDFWVIPSQAGLRYCAKDCRHEEPLLVIERNTKKDGHPKGCWECSLTPSSDYPCLKSKGEQLRASRLVLEAALGRPIAPGLLALHQCDNPRCVRVGPEHIHEGTQKKNIEEAMERGRNPKGINHGNALLTDEQVREIRVLKDVMDANSVALQFHIAPSTVYNIWLGFNRANVSG